MPSYFHLTNTPLSLNQLLDSFHREVFERFTAIEKIKLRNTKTQKETNGEKWSRNQQLDGNHESLKDWHK